MKVRLFSIMLTLLAAAPFAGCRTNHVPHTLPPTARLMEPGPGVGGPGPGVMPPPIPPQMVMQAPAPTVQVNFSKPELMQVQWDVSGGGDFNSTPLVVPGRQNFALGGIYRLKVTNIGGREGVELYPTLEIGPVTPRTGAFLAHNTIPVVLTEEDLDQVINGNFVTKVIYLPDPAFQEIALAGVETLVSNRLDPGVDPIVEADRRGSILAIIRVGNKDDQLPEMEMPIPAGGGAMGGPGVPPNYIAGVTGPQYGMPITGTPIGLPGPPHIPLGGPAGLQKHVMRNHTHMNIPGPTEKLKIHVKQSPGMSYPAPASRAYIHEAARRPVGNFVQPLENKHQVVPHGQQGDCESCR